MMCGGMCLFALVGYLYTELKERSQMQGHAQQPVSRALQTCGSST